MKRICFAATLFAAVGCGTSLPDEMATDSVPTTCTTLRASVDEATRTSLGGARGTDVLWSAGDQIGVWGDASAVNRRYEIDDRFAGEASADFTGESFVSTEYYGYYPYCPDAVVEGSGVVTTLPAVQAFAGSGTFAAGVNPMVARSSLPDRLQFGSVCGVVRLQLTGSATIRSVRLTTLDGAALAGRVRIEWDAAGGNWTMNPIGAGCSSLLLDCGAEGVGLSEAVPVQFCLVVPPGSYRGWRFTITDTAGKQQVRETSQQTVTLDANHLKTYNPFVYAPTGVASVPLDEEATANCYVVPRAGCYDFDATTMGNGAATPSDAGYAASGTAFGCAEGIVPHALRPVAAKLLWQTAPGLIAEVSLSEEGRLRFTTSDPFVEGNAVVAACDADGTILWSWHLWLTAADLEGTLHRYALPGDYAATGEAVLMDRNLGALAASYQGADNLPSYGMFYQWGRKDPFVPFRSPTERMSTYDAAGNRLADDTAAAGSFNAEAGWRLADGGKLGEAATVEACVRYPMNFVTEIRNGSEPQFYNWYAIPNGGLQRDDLWGCVNYVTPGADTGAKSIYDPCPPGYRVPHRFAWAAFAPTIDASYSDWYMQPGGLSARDGIVFTIAGQEIYYPAAGILLGTTGRSRFAGSGWYVWSNSPCEITRPQAGAFVKSSLMNRLSGYANRSYGAQVRCMKE